MIGFGLALAGVAAAIHVYIFVMESLTWTSDRTRATFGTSPQEAAATREMAFNQGFYNLFLAVLAALGAVLAVAGVTTVGITLMLAGTGCMLAAATVLLLSSPAHRGAAVKQGTLPLLAVITLLISLAL